MVYSQLKLTAKEMERFVLSVVLSGKREKGKGMPKDYYLYISPNIMGNLKETKRNEWDLFEKLQKRTEQR